MALTYAQLKAIQSKGQYANMDPKAFAALMGQMIGDPGATASLADPSWGSLVESGISGAIDATGVPQAFGSAGGFLFGETGRQVFEDIPRSAANILPLAIGGPIGLGGAAAMGGLQAWGDTEQMVPTLVGGALAGLTPGIAKVGGGLGVQGVRAAGGNTMGRLAGQFARGGGDEVAALTKNLALSNLPRTGGELAGMVAGEQAALLGASVAGDAASIAADPNRTIDELADPAYWAAQALGNLPFVGFDITQGKNAFRAGKAEAAGAPMALQQAWLRDQAARPFEGPAEGPQTVQQSAPGSEPFSTQPGPSSMWPPPQLYPPFEGGGLLPGPVATPQELARMAANKSSGISDIDPQALLDAAQFTRPGALSTWPRQNEIGPQDRIIEAPGPVLGASSEYPLFQLEDNSPLANEQRQQEQMRQRFLEEQAANVRPIELTNKVGQDAEKAALNDGVSNVERMPENNVADFATKAFTRQQHLDNLDSGDMGQVIESVRMLLPQREAGWLDGMLKTMTGKGVDRMEALLEVANIARSWAKSTLSYKRKTDILGSKDATDDTLSTSARAVWQQFELNDWMAQRGELAKTDPAVRAEIDLVDRLQSEHAKTLVNKDQNDRAVAVAWPAYKRWVESGGKLSLEKFLNRTIKLAKNTDEKRSKKQQSPLSMNQVSRDALTENRQDAMDAEAMLVAVREDRPDAVADLTEKAVRKGNKTFQDAIWPEELLNNPAYGPILEEVMTGLKAGNNSQQLMQRLAAKFSPEEMTEVAGDPLFAKVMKRVLSASDQYRDALVKGIDGAVDPVQKAEMEEQLRLRDMFDAEKDGSEMVSRLRGMLEMFGASPKEVARDLPTLTRLWNFSKAFQGTDLATLKNAQGRKNAGLYASDKAGRRLVAMKADRPQMLSWILAHELTGHGLWDAAQKGQLSPLHTEQLARFQKNVQAMTAQERRKMLFDAADSLPASLKNDPEVRALLETDLAHADADEVLANLNAIAALNLVSAKPSALREQIRFLPKWFTDVYNVAAQYMRKMTDVLRGVFSSTSRKQFDAHRKNLEGIMRESQANEIAAAQLALFERANAPGGMRDLLANADVAEANWRDLLDDPYGNKLADVFVKNLGGDDLKKVPHLLGAGAARAGRWLAHTLQPPVQFGSADKDFRIFANQQLTSNGELQREITQLMSKLGASYDGTVTKINQTGPESLVAKDLPVAEALNSAIIAVQKPRIVKDAAGNDVEVRMSVEEAWKKKDPEVVKLLEKLSDAQRNLLMEAAANRRQFHREGMAKLKELNQKFAAAQAVTTALRGPTGDPIGLSYEPAYKLLQGSLVNYRNLPVDVEGKVDPAVKMQFEQQVAQGLTQLGFDATHAGNAAGSFLDMLHSADRIHARQVVFDSYVNESRNGAYKVSFVVPKDSEYGKLFGYAEADHGYASAATLEDAEFIRKKYEDQGLQAVRVVKPTDFEATEHLKLTDDLANTIVQETANLADKLKARGFDEDTVDQVIKDFDLLHHIDRDYVAGKMGTLTVTRRFAPGRESLNMGEQQVNHVQSLLRGAQRRINEAVFKGMARDVKYADSPEAAALLTSWKNNMAPDTQLTQGIAKFGYFYALGGNLPNYAQEWIQGLTGFPAKLIDEGSSWRDAYGLVWQAQKDTAKMQLNKTFLGGGPMNTSHLPADEAAFMKEAMERGLMGNGMLAEVTADTLDKQYRKQKIAAGWVPDTVTSKTGEVADMMFNGVTRLHSKFTAGSTSTALLAAYRHLKKQGLSNKAAQDKAIVLFNEGMMVGGRYNRPAGLWDAGSWKPVAAMISALQSFTSNTIASTINYGRRAADGKLPKGERQAAASALVNQMLVQTAIAGVMGLPLVGPLLALAEKNLGFDLQAEMAKIAANAEDPMLASSVNQMALRGLFRGFGGPDVGARYGLGNVMGLNENDGFSFENFFGPVGSAIGRTIAGLGMLAKGDALGGVAELAPVAIRKPLKLWSDDWQFRSKEGNMLLEDATAAEKVMYAMGLQPQRLNQAREAYNMTKRAREREHKDEISFSREVADTLQGGNQHEAQMLLRKKAEESDMDYQDLVERVVTALETRTFQARPTREGSKQTAEVDAAIAHGYGQGAPIDEMEREQFKAELAGLLGGRPNEKRLREAAVIDEMRRKNPLLTVRQAKILLEKQRGRQVVQQAGLASLLGQQR